MRWFVAAGAMALTAVPAVLLFPEYALVGLFGLFCVPVFMFKQKLATGVAVVVVLLGPTLETVTGLSIFGYLDEVMVLLPLLFFAGARLLSGKALRLIPGLWLIGVYLIFGILGGLLREVPTLISVQSSIIMLKGFIFAFAVAQVNWNRADLRRMVIPAVTVLVATFAAAAINAFLPGEWTAVFSRRDKGIDYRFGLPSLIGPFDHEVAFGQFMALSAAAILAYRMTVRKSAGSALLLVGSLAGVLASFRRKAFASATVALIAGRLAVPGRTMSGAITVVALIPPLAFVGWDAFLTIFQSTYSEYFGQSTDVARVIMYRDSVALAASAFPFGVGFGRYGSFMASQVYSPVYSSLGYPFIYGLGLGDMHRGP